VPRFSQRAAQAVGLEASAAVHSEATNSSSRTHAAGLKVHARTEAVPEGRSPSYSWSSLLLCLVARHENEFCSSVLKVLNYVHNWMQMK